MWITILKRCWQVAIFKDSPANIPYSPLLLFIFGLLFFTLIVCQWYIAGMAILHDIGIYIAAGLSLITAYCMYTFLLLTFNNKKNRFCQTLTALFSSHFIIHLCAMPLLIVPSGLMSMKVNTNFSVLFGLIYLCLTLILTFWQFVVTAYIYKLALELNNVISAITSIGLLVFNILIISFW